MKVMNNPDTIIHELNTLSQDKKQFLIRLMNSTNQIKNQKDLMKVFLELKKESAQQNLEFSKEEIALIITIIKNNASEEEKEKINKLIKKDGFS